MHCDKYERNNHHKYLVLSAIISVDTYSTQNSRRGQTYPCAGLNCGTGSLQKLVRTWCNVILASF